MPIRIQTLLFDGFEALDVFGPVEILSKLPDAVIEYFSLSGGFVKSAQFVEVATKPISSALPQQVWLIPGGPGTRKLVEDDRFLAVLGKIAEQSSYCLSVCTGSALLAKSGVLDGLKATSNKRVFDWVSSTSANVLWIKKARWVVSGKYYISSGVSAGMDMALGFVRDIYGEEEAESIARRIEYFWNKDSQADLFAKSI